MLFPKQYNKLFKLLMRTNGVARDMVNDFLKSIPSNPFKNIDINSGKSRYRVAGEDWKADLQLQPDLVELKLVKYEKHKEYGVLITLLPLYVEGFNKNVKAQIINLVSEYNSDGEPFRVGEIGFKNFNTMLGREFAFTYDLCIKNGDFYIQPAQRVYENSTMVLNTQSFPVPIKTKDFAIKAEGKDIEETDYIDINGKFVPYYH